MATAFLDTTLADGRVFGVRIAAVTSYRSAGADQTEVSFSDAAPVTIALDSKKFAARLKAV